MTDAPSPASSQRLFSPIVALWMIVVGVFAFGAFFVLQAYAPDLRSGNDGGGHALSKSAIGYAGLVDVLKARGDPVIVSRGPLHTTADAPGLLILTPSEMTDGKALAHIKFAGDALIVLPKWDVMPDPQHPGWVRKLSPIQPEFVTTALPEGFHPKDLKLSRQKGVTRPTLQGGEQIFDSARTLAVGPTDAWQTLSGNGVTPIVTDSAGGIVLGLLTPPPQAPDASGAADTNTSTNDASSNSASSTDASTPDNNTAPAVTPVTPTKPATGIEGQVYVLSDPDLLNTHGLNDLTTTRSALAILDGLHSSGGPIALDVTLHGFSRGRSILKLAFEPPFLALTLCIFAAALMMGWHAYARFGPPVVPERAVAFGKAALVDNSSALIRVAKREPRMGARYVGVVRTIVANLVGAPRDLDRAELDNLLDRIGHSKQADVTIASLAEESASLKNNADLMRLAQRLHRWRTEMTRERR